LGGKESNWPVGQGSWVEMSVVEQDDRFKRVYEARCWMKKAVVKQGVELERV
jgi:hypothetical protein